MLKQIRCDKFMANGKVREPINFKYGLNAVVGDSEKSNSIGKSTLLMIIDFCFGGDDYTSKEKDTIEHVGDHTIYFTFEFDSKEYYFSRSTDEPRIVYEYADNNYLETKKKIHYDVFKSMLLKFYHLEELGLTFRQAVGRFFRIYNRKTHNEMRPLNADVREDDKSGIEFLLKIYQLYGDLDETIKEFDTFSDKKKVYDNLRRYNAGFIALNREEYDKNTKEIEKLKLDKEQLIDESKKGLSDINIVNAEIKTHLKRQRDSLRYQKRIETNKLNDIDFDSDYNEESLTSKFTALKEFFPELDVENIIKYEKFHKDVKKIITNEIKINKKDIEDSISFLNDQIKEVELELADFKETPDVSEALLRRHNQIVNRLKELQTANENFEKRQIAETEYKESLKHFNDTIEAKTKKLQMIVNNQMELINNNFENGSHYAPYLQINSLKSYSFSTPNDTGTGNRFKSVAIFDLAVLENTLLPTIVHDSIVFANIENPTTETLLKLYEQQTNKQVFIAFDKYDQLGGGITEILTRNLVLQLSDEPLSLFGKQWNRKETK